MTSRCQGLFPPHPFFKGKALGTRLINAVLACFDVLVSRLLNLWFPAKVHLKYKKVWGAGDGEQQVEGKFYDVAGFIRPT